MPLLRLFVVALLIAQAGAVCYLEDAADDCTVCWKTVFSGPDDGVGVTKMAACPDTIVAKYETELPMEMFEGTDYPVKFSLKLDLDDVEFTQGKGADDAMWDVPHANIHSCVSSRGACTPFVGNTPGLSTHTPASTGSIDQTGYSLFEGNVNLDTDSYTIIAHIRFFTPNEETGKASKYDIAVGMNRDVVPSIASVNLEAYIMAGVVGFLILLVASGIFYAVRSGKLDLDYIMSILFSDIVTLPSDLVCGLADAVAFTLSIIISVQPNNDLIQILPICWLFATLAWVVSLYCSVYDVYQMWDLYQSKYNPTGYDARMLKSLSSDFVNRHKTDEHKSSFKGSAKNVKEVRRRVSQEFDFKRSQSLGNTHHETMVTYDMANQDFSRRRRTVMSIFCESVPITAIQTYTLIEGGTSTVSVLALLLAALLLGAKMQGLGDYGNAKKRREAAQQRFDELFGGVDRLHSHVGKVYPDFIPATFASPADGRDLPSFEQVPSVQPAQLLPAPSAGAGIVQAAAQPYSLAAMPSAPAPSAGASFVSPSGGATPRDLGYTPRDLEARTVNMHNTGSQVPPGAAPWVFFQPAETPRWPNNFASRPGAQTVAQHEGTFSA